MTRISLDHIRHQQDALCKERPLPPIFDVMADEARIRANLRAAVKSERHYLPANPAPESPGVQYARWARRQHSASIRRTLHEIAWRSDLAAIAAEGAA